MFCPNCRRQLPDGTKFCGSCGTPLNVASAPAAAPVDPVVPVAPVKTAEKAPLIKPEVLEGIKNSVKNSIKKVPVKYLKIGGIALAALVLIIIVASLFSGGGEANYTMYIKDGQTYYNDFTKKAPYQITDDLMDDAENYELASNSYYIGRGMCLTEDGDKLFYLDKIDDGTGTLYYRSTSKLTKDPTKLAAGVSKYAVSEDGKTVTYLKGNTLYQHNLKEETKIAKDVREFEASSDGKILYYVDEEDTVYAYNKGTEEKVGSEIEIEYVTEDYKTVYFMDEDTLYKKELGKDKVKLVTDVSSVYGFNDKGTFYYTEAADVSLTDFFTWDEDHASWKESLQESETTLYYSLYYYNGKSAELVAEACGNRISSSCDDSYIMFYTQYDAAAVGGISMEKLETAYYESYYGLSTAAAELVQGLLAEDGVNYIVIDGTATEVSIENLSKLRVSPDGKTVYALCDVEESEGDLYKATVSGSKVGKFEEIDDSVSSEYGFSYASSSDSYSDYFCYYKDVKDYEGELCVNGESVDDDVYAYSSVRYNAKENELVYYVDYDRDDSEGTLKIYDGKKAVEVADSVHGYSIGENGKILYLYDYSSNKSKGSLALYDGKVKEIAEDVYNYAFTPDGDVVYLYDYSTSSYRGDLALYNGKKSQQIDEDVVALIPLYESSYYYAN